MMQLLFLLSLILTTFNITRAINYPPEIKDTNIKLGNGKHSFEKKTIHVTAANGTCGQFKISLKKDSPYKNIILVGHNLSYTSFLARWQKAVSIYNLTSPIIQLYDWTGDGKYDHYEISCHPPKSSLSQLSYSASKNNAINCNEVVEVESISHNIDCPSHTDSEGFKPLNLNRNANFETTIEELSK